MIPIFRKLWMDAVAYIALAIGAGLSIAGNVADTQRTRGQATDVLDVVLAVAWPSLVIIMVHMFVSRRWVDRGWAMQVIRWAMALGVGGIAMLASWIHLNDLMLSRHQPTLVAALGPLAIDALAIGATALLLPARSNTVHRLWDQMAQDPASARIERPCSETHVRRWAEQMAEGLTTAYDTCEPLSDSTLNQPIPYIPVHVDSNAGDQFWTDEHQEALEHYSKVSLEDSLAPEDAHWLDNLSRRVGQVEYTPAAPVPVVPGPTPKTTRKTTPDRAAALAEIRALLAMNADPGDIDARIAERHSMSTRNARRLRALITGSEDEASS